MPAACRAAASAARQASSAPKRCSNGCQRRQAGILGAEALLERRIRQSLHHQPHVMLLASNGANITGTAPCCKAGRLVDRRVSIELRAQCPHLFRAALRALSLRCFVVIFAALALPPFAP